MLACHRGGEVLYGDRQFGGGGILDDLDRQVMKKLLVETNHWSSTMFLPINYLFEWPARSDDLMPSVQS